MGPLATIPTRHTGRSRCGVMPELLRVRPRRGLHALAPHGPAGQPPRVDPLLTADEVAALLQVTKAWVYAQTRANRIPHVPLGRYVRYRRSAVLQWIAALERDSFRGGRVPLGRG
jgi:excisionase family DNA binding protein